MFQKAQLACILFLFVYVQSGPVKKPKIASRAYPCFDHQGSPKKPIPIGAPWQTDKCHLSTCIGVGIIMIRTCAVPGITCGPVCSKEKGKYTECDRMVCDVCVVSL
ncbi:uncharacterized protein LOC130628599 isoform X3 [Hydractinia symbiolongicarpus]|uniref:uncharacterized protein LOC130628599 isoform X3 n=1 Tax=Hydractinia symbiolongicarpus TaxID=13093 RepID=UPI00254E9C20|nr:uncharacterized protein LOC130628599 isoform X3 [Hydractinia symbiolongicarpus]